MVDEEKSLGNHWMFGFDINPNQYPKYIWSKSCLILYSGQNLHHWLHCSCSLARAHARLYQILKNVIVPTYNCKTNSTDKWCNHAYVQITSNDQAESLSTLTGLHSDVTVTTYGFTLPYSIPVGYQWYTFKVMSSEICSIFSRVTLALWAAMSVGRSVHLSVDP